MLCNFPDVVFRFLIYELYELQWLKMMLCKTNKLHCCRKKMPYIGQMPILQELLMQSCTRNEQTIDFKKIQFGPLKWTTSFSRISSFFFSASHLSTIKSWLSACLIRAARVQTIWIFLGALINVWADSYWWSVTTALWTLWRKRNNPPKHHLKSHSWKKTSQFWTELMLQLT